MRFDSHSRRFARRGRRACYTRPVADCFYEPDGDRFVSQPETIGPWDASLQHAGPPSALLARAFERLSPGMRVRRVTVELLRPIPIAPLTVRAEIVRTGKRAQWMSAALLHEDRDVARASGLAIRLVDVELPAHTRLEPALPMPDVSTPFVFPFFLSPVGYHTAVELRIAKGDWSRGPCGAWIRMRVPLVRGETPSPLQRAVVAADAGNGVSVTLPIDRFTFINADLTVHLHREPAGEWIGLDAITLPESDGTGLQHSLLHDTTGVVGRSLQSLVVGPRTG